MRAILLGAVALALVSDGSWAETPPDAPRAETATGSGLELTLAGTAIEYELGKPIIVALRIRRMSGDFLGLDKGCRLTMSFTGIAATASAAREWDVDVPIGSERVPKLAGSACVLWEAVSSASHCPRVGGYEIAARILDQRGTVLACRLPIVVRNAANEGTSLCQTWKQLENDRWYGNDGGYRMAITFCNDHPDDPLAAWALLYAWIDAQQYDREEWGPSLLQTLHARYPDSLASQWQTSAAVPSPGPWQPWKR